MPTVFQESPLDRSKLDELRSLQMPDRPNFMQEMVEIFACEAAPLLEEICLAAQEGRLEALEKPLHRLKGSSASMGARSLSATCRRMELLLEVGLGEKALAQLPRLQHNFAEAVNALKEEAAR
jgi:HPt (histidine-containing phosphotransfer) domain-containing protein